MPTPAIAGPGSDVGLRLSNVGGFASWQDLFDGASQSRAAPRTGAADGAADGAAGGAAAGAARSEELVESSEEQTGRIYARTLHAIVSAAVDEASDSRNGATKQNSSHGDRTAASGADVKDGVLHAATAWLNVNRSADYNEMHVHPDRWSAVYYVDPGEVAGEASVEAVGSSGVDGGSAEDGELTIVSAHECAVQARGCMVFRTGPSRQTRRQAASAMQQAAQQSTTSPLAADSGASSADPTAPVAALPSHSFFQVPPAAGLLWLFPGRMPHMVMGQHKVATVGMARPPPDGRGRCRVSVAVNFSEARPPPRRNVTPVTLP